MSIGNSPLPPNLLQLFNTEPIRAASKRFTGSNSGFADILTESLGAAGDTDRIDKASSLKLLMGEDDDLSGMLIDMQKAELSLNLALQIRNKVIDAYNEVMRMSV